MTLESIDPSHEANLEAVPVKSTPVLILCCECGVSIPPNTVNKCVVCVRNGLDITENIPKSGMIQFCSGCDKYFEPPTTWVRAAMETKDLLRVCLKKLKNLNEVKLINAGFVWTEAHSKRIKVKLVVEKEVIKGTILQQSFVAEFTIQHLMCEECHRVEAKDYWNAVVQVRQKTDHKRTFYYLEQLLLKHDIHKKALSIKTEKDGIDFFFNHEQMGAYLVEFLRSVVPCRWSRAKKLKSHDIHSNTYNYKHTFCVEVVPVCRGSVVCLSKKLALQLGGISQICLVQRVAGTISLIDPTTAQMAEVTNELYWRYPFKAIASSKKQVEFVVMDTEETSVAKFAGQGALSHKHKVGNVWIQRQSEVGIGDPIFCKTHLFHLLEIGDSVFGFDLRNSNTNDDNMNKIKEDEIPDVIISKKIFGSKVYRNRRRQWRLKHMGVNDDLNSQNDDYVEFLEDLEEDPEIRANINIFQKKEQKPFEIDEELEQNMPTVDVSEMLEDLVDSDDEDANLSGETLSTKDVIVEEENPSDEILPTKKDVEKNGPKKD